MVEAVWSEVNAESRYGITEVTNALRARYCHRCVWLGL